MNVFTTDAFLETAGELFFPRGRREVRPFVLEGRALKLLTVDGSVVRSMPFYDFPQPLEVVPPNAQPLPYFPRMVLRTERVTGHHSPVVGQQPSPYVDWSLFTTWESFMAHAGQQGLRLNDSDRQTRRIERDLGPLRFVFDDPSPTAFAAGIAWKSAQYQSTGVGDMFARPQNVELFRRLRARGLVVHSSLYAGDQLVATHLGAVANRRHAWWVPAYDVKFQKYSPGRLLLERLLRASQTAGDVEFDFLIGDEAYKFHYGTHNRVIGPLGTPPLREQVFSDARVLAKKVLLRFPRSYEAARAIKRRLTS